MKVCRIRERNNDKPNFLNIKIKNQIIAYLKQLRK